MDDLEDAYWLQFDAETHTRHHDFAAAAAARGATLDADARWDVEAGGAEIVLLTPDRVGVFAAIAAAIARVNGDVRRARIYTTSRGFAVEYFWVTPPQGTDLATDGGWLARLKAAALAAAAGETDAGGVEDKVSRRAAAFRVPSMVAFDNDASADATVIEVSGRDRPGLLADLTGALASLGVGLSSANVESVGERAMDVFYVVERDGGKVADAKRRAAIKAALLAAFEVGAPDAPRSGGRELARARASSAR